MLLVMAANEAIVYVFVDFDFGLGCLLAEVRIAGFAFMAGWRLFSDVLTLMSIIDVGVWCP